jgi:oligoribonuclease
MSGTLGTFSPYCSHHTKSGLFDSCLKSTISIEQAEQMILAFLHQCGVKKGELVLAGNSVHQDKLFLFHQMAQLN